MTPFRVVARAASACLIIGCFSTASPAVAASDGSSRLDALGRGFFPGVGDLLRPSYAPWPRFFDPGTGASRGGKILTDIAALAPSGAAVSPVRLDARQRRDLGHRLTTALPRYADLFAGAARSYGLPAGLIAAVAYIESKWRPAAHHRDVAGMMMLSSSAARQVGVSDRLSATESVRGGAHYLARLRSYISPAVPLPDRNYFALAAYNMGIGHLRMPRRWRGGSARTRTCGRISAR